MLRLHRLDCTPPGGYRYRVSETNRDFHAWTYPALIQEVVTYLQSNGLPVPADLEAKIQEFTCQGLGSDWCVEDDPRRSWFAGARLTFGVIMAATKTLGKHREGYKRRSVKQGEFDDWEAERVRVKP